MSTAKAALQPAEMVPRDNDTATVSHAATELTPPTMDWSAEGKQGIRGV